MAEQGANGKNEAIASAIASFEAYIPTIKSAILFGSDGAQLKLEIPGSDLDEALKLAKHGQNKILRVVVFEASQGSTS